MHNADYTTEYEVENKFIDIIKRNWYTFSPISSYEDLVQNFRVKLNQLNKDILGDEELSNTEFKEILMYLESKNIFDASQLIRENAGKGKIDIIKRNNSPLYLKLVDLKNIENNRFEVAHQIKTVGDYCLAYGALTNYEVPVFSAVEIAKSSDYKFKDGIICYKSSVFTGGNVVGFNGFLRIKKKAAEVKSTSSK